MTTGAQHPAPGPRRRGARGGRRRRLGILGLVVVALPVAAVVEAFVVEAYYIPSVSMLPQLHVDDRVVVSRLAYDLHQPRRGDIVVLPAPPGEGPGSWPAATHWCGPWST